MEESVTISLVKYERLKALDEVFNKSLKNEELKSFCVGNLYHSTTYYVRKDADILQEIIKCNSDLRNQIYSLEKEIEDLKKKK